MKIFNSLTGKKETFKPINKNSISIYVCGMTVYDFCHIGHARTFVSFDVVVNFLKSLGNKVTYVRNITDIDDKIIDEARKQNIHPIELSARYTKEMKKDFASLGISEPDIEPKVSDHIVEILEYIKVLEEKGYAYTENSSDVFFDVSKYKDYGKLSNRTLEDLKAGSRVELDKNKKNASDFVLWKQDDANFCWDSPWGKGRPGWHIECSAMSTKYLGSTFDIHGGGLDLKFPHHENEIAQSVCASDTDFARVWMHTGPLNIGEKKMSKSLKNFLKISDVLKDFHPEVLRLFYLMTHYRSPISFSKERLNEAKIVLDKFYVLLEDYEGEPKPKKNNEFIKEFNRALEDDFNTPKAIKLAQRYVQDIDSNKQLRTEILENVIFVFNILGLLNESAEDYFKYGVSEKAKEDIQVLIDQRNIARQEKDFELADQIRNQLIDLGITLEDKEGKTLWKVLKAK